MLKNHRKLLNQITAGTYPTMVCNTPQQTGKIRFAFVFIAEHHGVSINKELLPGPDLTNQIVGVLLRFREELIAVTGDIEAMFHQVKVPVKQRNYLRFIWWKDSDLDKDVVDHEMAAHVFGGVYSPTCSNYALKKTASDNLKKYGEDVASILRWNFYVDDMLKSFSSIEIAVRITGNVQELWKEEVFNLTKFYSNNLVVLKTIQDKDKKDGVEDKDLAIGVLAEDKALGLRWDVGKDTLGFQIKTSDKPVTRRGLLAALSSVYNPAGL